MLLITKRLIIATVREPFFDPDISTIVYFNNIYLNTPNLSEKKILSNPNILGNLHPIGQISCGSNGWIDYLILSKYQNNGYATESLVAARDFAIKNGVSPFLLINDSNLPSLRVAHKAGFQLVTKLKKSGRYYYSGK